MIGLDVLLRSPFLFAAWYGSPPHTDALTMRFRSMLCRKELHKVVQHVQLWASRQLAPLFWLSRLDFML